MSQDYEDGFAVTVAARDGRWVVREFEDDFTSLSTSVSAVRALRSEGPAFAILNVEEDYFVVVRPGPSRTRLLISDATMAVDDDFAADVLDEAGIDIPDIEPETLDDIDGWADGDFDIFADLGLSEQVLSVLLDGDDDPYVAIERIAEEIGFSDELAQCLD
ncbi:tRNA adenosine deaminase-associated protein [Corynebacterium auris]|uniref:tRNA adenosine deaminase-associated protein n=1 Tax=Corynebacterium auris TaxID=44750 RepID=UPI0025B5194C|nr:tRNA adenosine deaminase-associated protein [Corynebacterium auris]WJY67085.1 hypothetical protein CAURIS_00705 [Corynebacterium auris]